MNTRLKEIESLYGKNWPFSYSEGVGLHLVGNPTDKEKFLEVLGDFSCNRIAGMRILNDLMIVGERKVTVMFSIPLMNVFHLLKELGVEMTVIEPANHSSPKYFAASSNWDYEIGLIIETEAPLNNFLNDKTPIERQIFLERLESARLSKALVLIESNN